MTIPNGPGNPLDAHGADTSAHSGLFLAAGSVVGPRIIAPPGAVLAASSLATWYTANAATFLRFTVPVTKNYRYVNLYVGASSGNIQVGVSSVALNSDTSVDTTRVMSSGVVACPGANAATRIDCGDTSLTAGDYALFLWCDNTTATFMHGLATGLTASRLVFTQTGLSSGVGSGVVTVSVTTRWVSGLTLESAT